MVAHYTPKVNDYVKWKNLEGWVYFRDDEYITIENAPKELITRKSTFL
jgi:hypothetical protein